MGDPRLPRRVWKKPKRPLNYDLKMSELKTLGEFGLKTKRELWKAHTELSRLRNQARSILALGQDVRQNKEPILIRSLVKVGLVPENSTLDDVLNLQVVDMLSRRLQTMCNEKSRIPKLHRSMSFLMVNSISEVNKCISFPVSGSFRLLRNHMGNPAFAGSFKTPSMAVTFASVRYPILESGFICNFVRMADAKLYPMPRMCVRPVRTLRSPGMSFPTILTICLYS